MQRRSNAHQRIGKQKRENGRLILGKLNSRCNARLVIRTIDWWHQNISVRLTGGWLSLTSGPSFSGIVIDFNIGAAPLTPFTRSIAKVTRVSRNTHRSASRPNNPVTRFHLRDFNFLGSFSSPPNTFPFFFSSRASNEPRGAFISSYRWKCTWRNCLTLKNWNLIFFFNFIATI